ncbi:DegT/DnrJ/EryC1/StrS family aminotransferase [Agarivorans albus]
MAKSLRTEPLLVQCPSLPDREVLNSYIDKVYEAKWITNNGQLVQELEQSLTEFLDVPYLVLTSNGTAALQLALKLYDIEKEVVTTPFTFAATGQAINWVGAKAVFADIDSKSLCLSPSSVADQITTKTQAILPVNVYGRTAHNQEFENLARKHNLKLIYDGAQSFAAPSLHQKLALNSGDATALSFHATKVFNTIEGGALILKSKEDYLKAKALINFGFSAGLPGKVGTNAKMNELEAAFGLANLKDIEYQLTTRKALTEEYLSRLAELEKLKLIRVIKSPNFSYMPVLFRDEATLLSVDKLLKQHNIFGRRYFHPLQPGCELESTAVAQAISSTAFCLPLHTNMTIKCVNEVVEIIKQALELTQSDFSNLNEVG